jgi:hypothetical protein
MHYVLVPFDLPEVDTAAYELVVDGRVHSLALTLDEAGGRIWRRVRSRWHDEAIRVRRVDGDAAARGCGGCSTTRCDSPSRGFSPTPTASSASIRRSISADGGTVRLTA